MGKRIDLTGQKFGRLTVIELSHINEGGYACWLCGCVCGNKKIIRSSDLRRGFTKSCGCLAKETFKKMLEKHKLPEGIAGRNQIVRQHKAHAKRRNIKQALTDEQIIILHKRDCHYCGAPPSNMYSHPDYNGSYTYNGIDRVNNDIGYLLDNVVPCCELCNHNKSNLSLEEFLNWVKRIHSHLNL